MTLLVLIAILLIETFLPHLVLWRRHNMVLAYSYNWLEWLSKKIDLPKWCELLAVLLPPMFLLGLLLDMEQGVVGFLLTSLVGLVVVFWCLGPQSLADYFDHIESDNESSARKFIVFSHQGYFAIIIWFVLAGPIMALAYRITHIMAAEVEDHELWQKLLHLLDWLPARVTGLLFMMTGNFVGGLRAYRDLAPEWYASNRELVEQVGLASLVEGTADSESETGIARQASERSLILLIVIVALVTLFDV